MISRVLVTLAPLAYAVLGFPCITGPLQSGYRLASGGSVAAILLADFFPDASWRHLAIRAALVLNLFAMAIMSHWWCFSFASWVLLAGAVITFQVVAALRVKGFLFHTVCACLVLLVTFVSRVGALPECMSDPDRLEAASQKWCTLSGSLVVAGLCEFGVASFRSGSLLRRKLGALQALLTAPLSEFEARLTAADYANEELDMNSIVPLFDGVTLSKRIGRGSFGQVFYGKWMGQGVAVKIVLRLPDTDQREALLREPLIAINLNHPQLVATYLSGVRFKDGSKEMLEPAKGSGALVDGNAQLGKLAPKPIVEIWMLQEFCDRGTLHEFCSTPRWAPEHLPEACDMLLDVTKALVYLHGQSLIHGDLTGNNILLKSDTTSSKGFVCKVSDFGTMLRILEGNTSTIATTFGTVTHMPPEHFNLEGKTRLTRASDVYAAGVLLWQAIMGEQPFDGVHPTNVVVFVSEGKRLELSGEVPEPLRELYSSCVATDPAARPGFEQVASALEPFIR
mmetsp:Transcript_22034/g.62646  ORF Transcript_22034/g.62646 Transcript_22034/m.62646 type:complete len:509 (-) Transcript_22034:164-1690(-)